MVGCIVGDLVGDDFFGGDKGEIGDFVGCIGGDFVGNVVGSVEGDLVGGLDNDAAGDFVGARVVGDLAVGDSVGEMTGRGWLVILWASWSVMRLERSLVTALGEACLGRVGVSRYQQEPKRLPVLVPHRSLDLRPTRYQLQQVPNRICSHPTF